MNGDLITPVVLTSVSGSTNLPAVVHDLGNGAWYRDLRRTPTSQLPLPLFGDEDPLILSDRVEPLRPDVARLYTTVLGLWVHYGPHGCRPDLGQHEDGCWHGKNRIPTSDSAVARLTFGEGGPQRMAARRALDAAYRYNTPILVRKDGGFVEKKYHLLSYDRDVRFGETDAKILIALDPFIHEAMMDGRYQSLPMALVRKLRGSDFLLWEQALSHPRAAKLKKVGDSDALSLGGPRSSIPFDRIGLGRTRADKRPAAIRRGIEEGNDLQGDWHFELDEGLLVIERVTSRGRVSRDGGGVTEDAGRVSQDGLGGNSGRESCSNGVTDWIGTGHRLDKRPIPSSSEEENPDLAFLEKHFRQPLRPNTDKLIRRLEKQKELSRLEAVEVMRVWLDKGGKDPIEGLKEYRIPSRPIRPIEDIEEPVIPRPVPTAEDLARYAQVAQEWRERLKRGADEAA